MAVAEVQLIELAKQHGVKQWLCDYCRRVPGMSQPGLQFPTRHNGEKVLVEGDCLRAWQAKEANFKSASAQGGDNGGGPRQFVRHYQSQRR